MSIGNWAALILLLYLVVYLWRKNRANIFPLLIHWKFAYFIALRIPNNIAHINNIYSSCLPLQKDKAFLIHYMDFSSIPFSINDFFYFGNEGGHHREPQSSSLYAHTRTQYVNINRKTKETLRNTHYWRSQSSLRWWFNQKCGLIIFQLSCQAFAGHSLALTRHSISYNTTLARTNNLFYFSDFLVRDAVLNLLGCLDVCVWFWHYMYWVIRAGVLLFGRHIKFFSSSKFRFGNEMP